MEEPNEIKSFVENHLVQNDNSTLTINKIYDCYRDWEFNPKIKRVPVHLLIRGLTKDADQIIVISPSAEHPKMNKKELLYRLELLLGVKIVKGMLIGWKLKEN